MAMAPRIAVGDRVTFPTRHRLGPGKTYVGTVERLAGGMAYIRDADPAVTRLSIVAVATLQQVQP